MSKKVIDLTLQSSSPVLAASASVSNSTPDTAELPPVGALNRDIPISRHDSLAILSSDPFVSSPLKTVSRPPPAAQSLDPFGSDPFASSPPPPQQARPSSHRVVEAQSKGKRPIAAWDPISSSLPESSPAPLHRPSTTGQPVTKRPRASSVVLIESSDVDGIGAGNSHSDDDDDEELPDIADFDLSQARQFSYKSVLQASQNASGPSRRKPLTKAMSGAGRLERVQTSTTSTAEQREQKTTKAAEREQKKREREKAKAAKQFEKERAAAIAEVNKARADRKVSSTEMIVDLPASLDASLRDQIVLLLESLNIHHTISDASTNNLITWRRKVRSRFDDESGQWVPAPARIEHEPHVLKIMTAEKLVDLAMHEKLDESANQIKSQYPQHQVIYILEGVTAWTRKNRNIRNRQFAAEVRGTNSNARNRQEYVSEDIIEDAMLQLQIEHDFLLHHTAVPNETAQWVVTFTQHISTVPYRKQRDESTSTARFCMDTGQVKTGEDANDTYVRMLQEIVRVTAPIAYGVASEFGTVSQLAWGLEQGGPGRLDQVRKSANREGVSSDRTIGQAVSRRMHKIFTGRDETSTDI